MLHAPHSTNMISSEILHFWHDLHSITHFLTSNHGFMHYLTAPTLWIRKKSKSVEQAIDSWMEFLWEKIQLSDASLTNSAGVFSFDADYIFVSSLWHVYYIVSSNFRFPSQLVIMPVLHRSHIWFHGIHDFRHYLDLNPTSPSKIMWKGSEAISLSFPSMPNHQLSANVSGPAETRPIYLQLMSVAEQASRRSEGTRQDEVG